MKDVSHYFNRDLSWLAFNDRVLEEAKDESNPLLERLKFVSIVASNLDEFMSVRVAGVLDQIHMGYTKLDFSGYTPMGLLKRIMKRSSRMVREQYEVYNELHKSLQREGIGFVRYDELNVQQQHAADKYYRELIFPVLTPMAVDQSRPFPLVHSRNLYLAVVLRREETDEEEPYFAILQVPANLPRYIPVLASPGSKIKQWILLEDLIRHHVANMFEGYTLLSADAFRLTRNADLSFDEDSVEDLLEEIEKKLHRRKWGAPVRMEIEEGFHPYSLRMLKQEFGVKDHIFTIQGPLDLSYLMSFSLNIKGVDYLRYSPVEPVYPQEFDAKQSMFEVLHNRDVLVYHPYESFDAVEDFVSQAVHDPSVLAIKITLYRVSGNSVIVTSLAEAAANGKQVTVVVELKARFDEERNIAWAKRLEQAGCHVVYGLVGLKTHAKVTLVVRQEGNRLHRYVHLGTGNYNNQTARLYTDIGLFTAHESIAEDAAALFNEITGYASPHRWKELCVAPDGLKNKLIQLIRREAEHARQGEPARIIAKMNSLSNQEVIDELYTASQVGVKIDLIVRGICSLRPGIFGLSENITVRSIVDRYLEHSRIFYFGCGGEPKVWIASADWMSRNLNRRIELMTPLLDTDVKNTVLQVLNLSLRDTVKARILLPNGRYQKIKAEGTPFRSQFAAHTINTWKDSSVKHLPYESPGPIFF